MLQEEPSNFQNWTKVQRPRVATNFYHIQNTICIKHPLSNNFIPSLYTHETNKSREKDHSSIYNDYNYMDYLPVCNNMYTNIDAALR